MPSTGPISRVVPISVAGIDSGQTIISTFVKWCNVDNNKCSTSVTEHTQQDGVTVQFEGMFSAASLLAAAQRKGWSNPDYTAYGTREGVFRGRGTADHAHHAPR